MKIVFVCNEYPPRPHGGIGTFVHTIARALLQKGHQVTVVGSRAPNSTGEEILAREVTVGNNTITLRDDQGVPVWAGWNPSAGVK